jgi:hypothetical protein
MISPPSFPLLKGRIGKSQEGHETKSLAPVKETLIEERLLRVPIGVALKSREALSTNKEE